MIPICMSLLLCVPQIHENLGLVLEYLYDHEGANEDGIVFHECIGVFPLSPMTISVSFIHQEIFAEWVRSNISLLVGKEGGR